MEILKVELEIIKEKISLTKDKLLFFSTLTAGSFWGMTKNIIALGKLILLLMTVIGFIGAIIYLFKLISFSKELDLLHKNLKG